MHPSYDAIVVGGGPAGSTFALCAARHGLNVLLVDKERFPRDKLCGDVLPGPCFPVLEDLGLVDRVMALPSRRVSEQVFFTEDQCLRPRSSGNYGGLVVRRALFDDLLFGAAKERVATREGFCVSELLFDGERVSGVRGAQGGDQPSDFTAQVVVGADGAGSVVARRLGLHTSSSGPGAVATRLYYRDLPHRPDTLEFHFLPECVPGYFWIFPVDGDVANVGLGLFRGTKGPLKGLHRKIERTGVLGERFHAATPLSALRGWYLPIAGERRTVHGDGFLLTGDAAGLVDPFLGHGIDTAMLSGRLAADVLAETILEGDLGAPSLARYPERLWALLGDGFAFSDALHRAMESPPLSFPYSSRLEILNTHFLGGAGELAKRTAA
jgi:geranylgeranyl reductase family protein